MEDSGRGPDVCRPRGTTPASAALLYRRVDDVGKELNDGRLDNEPPDLRAYGEASAYRDGDELSVE